MIFFSYLYVNSTGDVAVRTLVEVNRGDVTPYDGAPAERGDIMLVTGELNSDVKKEK